MQAVYGLVGIVLLLLAYIAVTHNAPPGSHSDGDGRLVLVVWVGSLVAISIMVGRRAERTRRQKLLQWSFMATTLTVCLVALFLIDYDFGSPSLTWFCSLPVWLLFRHAMNFGLPRVVEIGSRQGSALGP